MIHSYELHIHIGHLCLCLETYQCRRNHGGTFEIYLLPKNWFTVEFLKDKNGFPLYNKKTDRFFLSTLPTVNPCFGKPYMITYRQITGLSWIGVSFFQWKKQLTTNHLHRKLTWNLKRMVSKRILLFQRSIFRFHVGFRGSTHSSQPKPSSGKNNTLLFNIGITTKQVTIITWQV